MKHTRCSLTKNGFSGDLFSFDRNVARELGIYEAILLGFFEFRCAYIGPDGRGWLPMNARDWEYDFEFMKLGLIESTILNLIATQDVLIPASQCKWVSHSFNTDPHMSIEYLISPQRITFAPQEGGYIYLFQAGELFKIGKTLDPQRRHRELITASLSISSSWGYMQSGDMHWHERALHQMFAKQRVKGEWFSLSSEDVAFLIFKGVSDSGLMTEEIAESLSKLGEPLSLLLGEYEGRFQKAGKETRPCRSVFKELGSESHRLFKNRFHYANATAATYYSKPIRRSKDDY